MESAKLEIVLHYGNNLRDVKYLGTMDPYAIVWIAGGDDNQFKQITPIAKKGACNPKWECSMDFDILPFNRDYILCFEIKHGGKLFDRKIGNVQVPFADLLAKHNPRDNVSYPVTTPFGEKKGEIIVSHKFSGLVARSDDDDGNDTRTSKVAAGPPGKKKRGGTTERNAKKVMMNSDRLKPEDRNELSAQPAVNYSQKNKTGDEDDEYEEYDDRDEERN